jgi:hypothetical protein
MFYGTACITFMVSWVRVILEHNNILIDSMSSMVWDFTELYYGT